MKGKNFILFSLFAVTALLLGGCGKSSGGGGLGDSLSSLSQLPSADKMLTGTGANGSFKKSFLTERLDLKFLSAINLQTVAGTPPVLKDITATTADTYFWGGLIAVVNSSWNSKTTNEKNTIRNQFWGQDTTTPGPGGQGSCMMGQSVAESLSRIGDAAGTMCYMKGITSGPSGVTVTGSTAAAAFTQEAGDKVVKVAVSGMEEHHRENMDVFFKIYGSNTVTSNIYKYDMWMCRSGAATSKESLTVNKTTGVMTTTMSQSEGGGSIGEMELTMSLKDSNGTIIIDPSKDRTGVSKFKGTWGTFASKVVLTSKDWIYGWRYNNSNWGTDYNFSLAAYTGTSADTFAFLQAAYKGKSTMSGQSAHSYSGITEYQNTKYVAVSSSDLSTDATYSGMDFATDAFFVAAGTDPSFSNTGLDCSTTANITIAMDFTQAGVKAVQTTCDGEKGKFSNYEMCNSSTMQSAMQKLWQ